MGRVAREMVEQAGVDVNVLLEKLVAAALRAAGLRVTACPTGAVLQALPAHAHLSVEEIAASARWRLGSLSTQAAYDNLDVLTRAGLVRRLKPASSRPGSRSEWAITTITRCAGRAVPCSTWTASSGSHRVSCPVRPLRRRPGRR